MTTDAVGGVWTYALDLAAGLAEAGVRVSLAVLGPPPTADQIAEAAATPGLDLIDTGLPLDWTAEDARALDQAGRGVSDLAAELGVDLVHLNAPALAGAARFRQPVVSVAHSCLATWWRAVRGGPPPEDFRWRIEAHRRGLLASDAVIAPSGAFADDTMRAYDTVRPFVVPNGRRPDTAPARASRSGVVTTGRLWDDGKNIATLDRAAARLPFPLKAIGPLTGPHGERRRVDDAIAVGRLSAEAVRVELSAAAIFASASLYEPFGLGVLEAAQAGCALVLSDIPTFRELWNGAALFAPGRDDAAFASAIQALCDDDHRREALGLAARAQAARYGVEAMTAGVLDIYARLAPGLGPSVRREVAA
ncbi:glycosyltransferase family 4 protein [uncultured Caulobacter sp.]|uniref:glycosyltransferase family 4 protein n=1 Tax=uncultured Caulobacter sp. TaxID=158749 RepID=UPI0026399B87|nr:glycosyltransferase family 4 protein [uncultured Caulobacter sp.]